MTPKKELIRPRVNPDDEAIDGFTWEEIAIMSLDPIVDAICDRCGAHTEVPPMVCHVDCDECGAAASITSPLVKIGMV